MLALKKVSIANGAYLAFEPSSQYVQRIYEEWDIPFNVFYQIKIYTELSISNDLSEYKMNLQATLYQIYILYNEYLIWVIFFCDKISEERYKNIF